jgi:1,4-alpha-glucan branching enzyme
LARTKPAYSFAVFLRILEIAVDRLLASLQGGIELGQMANQHRDTADTLTERALNQAARELLLAQSSDWAFIMKTNTMVEYAVKRTKDHVLAFTDLYFMIRGGQIDEGFVANLEWKNNIFPFLSFRVYADPR